MTGRSMRHPNHHSPAHSATGQQPIAQDRVCGLPSESDDAFHVPDEQPRRTRFPWSSAKPRHARLQNPREHEKSRVSQTLTNADGFKPRERGGVHLHHHRCAGPMLTCDQPAVTGRNCSLCWPAARRVRPRPTGQLPTGRPTPPTAAPRADRRSRLAPGSPRFRTGVRCFSRCRRQKTAYFPSFQGVVRPLVGALVDARNPQKCGFLRFFGVGGGLGLRRSAYSRAAASRRSSQRCTCIASR
jgi:hypothetical protein